MDEQPDRVTDATPRELPEELAPPSPGELPGELAPAKPTPAGEERVEHTPTRASGFWAAVVAGVVVLVVLLVFILENTKQVSVTLFGASWRVPLGVSLLLAAAIGALVVVAAGTARILELRRRARHSERRLSTDRSARHDG